MSNDTFRDYLDNKLGSIDSHVSELIPDTAELRAMRVNNPELYRDFIDRWLTTIDDHIVDIINGGGIHPGPTPPVPPVTDALIFEWDFTNSLIDVKRNAPLTVANSYNLDSNGITFNADNTSIYNSNIYFVGAYNNFKIDIEFGNYSLTGGSASFTNRVLLWNSSPLNGIGRFGNNYWQVWESGNNHEIPGSSDINFFRNSKLTVEFGNNTVNVYKNDVLLLSTSSGNRNNIRFGSISSSDRLLGLIIKKFKVYAKNN